MECCLEKMELFVSRILGAWRRTSMFISMKKVAGGLACSLKSPCGYWLLEQTQEVR